MSETELHWLAGWLEGEGTFVVTSGAAHGKRYPRIRINATSTDRDVLDRVQELAGGKIYGPYPGGKQWKHPKEVFQWTLSTHRQCEWLLRKLLPLMVAERRKNQVRLALTAIEEYAKQPHGSRSV